MREILDILSEGWVGSLVGIAGLVAGLLLYRRSVRTAKPSFQKSALRLLGRKVDSLPAEVEVFFRSERIERLTRTTLIFWNNGTKVLYGDKIVKKDPIRICFHHDDRVLSFEIVKTTKEVNDFSIDRDNDKPYQLLLNFSYLDPGDGASVELFHDSNSRYPKVTGSIMGLPRGFEDLGIVDTMTVGLSSASLIETLVQNRRFALWVLVVLGLGIATMGVLPAEVRAAMAFPEDTEVPWWVMVGLGLLYSAAPAALLWLRRKRHPKALSLDHS